MGRFGRRGAIQPRPPGPSDPEKSVEEGGGGYGELIRNNCKSGTSNSEGARAVLDANAKGKGGGLAGNSVGDGGGGEWSCLGLPCLGVGCR